MEELDLVLEERNVLQEQMKQMKTLEPILESGLQMKPGQLEEVKANIEMGEQRLWELDRMLEDQSKHRDNSDD